MVVSCSEIAICVIVNHVQHIGIIKGFFLPRGTYLSFQCLGRQKKLVLVSDTMHIDIKRKYKEDIQRSHHIHRKMKTDS